MEQVIGSLSVLLGFKADDTALKKFDNGIKKVAKSLQGFKTQLTIANTVLAVFVSQTLNKFSGLEQSAMYLNTTTQALQQFYIAGEKAGATTESLTGALDQVRKIQLDNLNGKATNLSAWSYLGVDVRNGNPIEVLNRLNDKMKSMSNTQKGQTLNRLGLSNSLINSLGNIQNDSSLSQLIASPEETKQIKEMNVAFREMRLAISLLRDRFVAMATPIKYLFELITRLVKIFDSAIKGTIGWERFSKYLTFALIGLMFIIRPITATIGLLALVIEDLWVYFHDGESVTGKLVEWFKNANVAAKSLSAAFAAIIAAMAVQKVMSWGETMIKTIKAVNSAITGTPLGLLLASATFLYNSPKIGNFLGEKFGNTKAGEVTGDYLLGIKNWFGGLSGNTAKTFQDNKTVNINISGNNADEIAGKVQNVITQSDINMIYEFSNDK